MSATSKKKVRKALYPGSFDPITLGHLNIIERLSHCFDEIVVLVASSDSKDYLFSINEREEMIRSEIKKFSNVSVASHAGLTVEFADKIGANVIVRGLRAVADFEYEMSIAHMNQRLDENIETMIIFSDPRFSFVSSKLLKEVARHGGDVSDFVSESVQKSLQKKLKKRAEK